MRKKSQRVTLMASGALAGIASTMAFGSVQALSSAADAGLGLGGFSDGSLPGPTASSTPQAGSTNSSKSPSAATSSAAATASATTKTPTVKKTTKPTKPSTKPVTNPTTAAPSTPAVVNGDFTGSSVRAGAYGSVKVQIRVANGQITDIAFLSYPNSDGRSQQLSASALPQLKQAALAAQSASIGAVGGASYTSRAFNASLQSAIMAAGL